MNEMKNPVFRIEEDNIWLNAVAFKLNKPDRKDLAYDVLKIVLHVIRDKMVLHEVFLLSAHLPNYVRGIYFEGYNPEEIPVMIYNKEFLKRYHRRMGPKNSFYLENYLDQYRVEQICRNELIQLVSEKIDPEQNVDPEHAFWAVLEVIYERISMDDLKLKKLKNLMKNNTQQILA